MIIPTWRNTLLINQITIVVCTASYAVTGDSPFAWCAFFAIVLTLVCALAITQGAR